MDIHEAPMGDPRGAKQLQSSSGFLGPRKLITRDSSRAGKTGTTDDGQSELSRTASSGSLETFHTLPIRCSSSRCSVPSNVSCKSSEGDAPMHANVDPEGKSSARFSTASSIVRTSSLQTNQNSSLPNRNRIHPPPQQSSPPSEASTSTSTPSSALRLRQLSCFPNAAAAPPPRSNKGLLTPDAATSYQPSHSSWAPPAAQKEGGFVEACFRSLSCSRSPSRSGPPRSLRSDSNTIEFISSPACLDSRMAAPRSPSLAGAQSPRFARSQVQRFSSAPCLATASSSNSCAAPSQQPPSRYNGRLQMAGGDLPSQFVSPFLSPRASASLPNAFSSLGAPGMSQTQSPKASLATPFIGPPRTSALSPRGSLATNTMAPAPPRTSALSPRGSLATNTMAPARTPAAPSRSPGCLPVPLGVQRFSSAPSPRLMPSASTTGEWQYPHSLNGSMQAAVASLQAAVASTLPAQGAELSNGAPKLRMADTQKCLPVKVASQEVASTFAQMPFCQSQPGLSAFAFGQSASKYQTTGAARATSPTLCTRTTVLPMPPLSPALTDTQLNYSATSPRSPDCRVVSPYRTISPDCRSISPGPQGGFSSVAIGQRTPRSLSPGPQGGFSSVAIGQRTPRSLSPGPQGGLPSVTVGQRTPDHRSLSPGPRRGLSPIAAGQRTPESRSLSPCPQMESPRYAVANSKPMSNIRVAALSGGRLSPNRLRETPTSPSRLHQNGIKSPRRASPTTCLAPLRQAGPQHFSISTPRGTRSCGQLTPRSLGQLTPRSIPGTPGGSVQLPHPIIVNRKSRRQAKPKLVDQMRPFKSSRFVQKLMKQKSRKSHRKSKERVSFGFSCKPRVGEWIGLRTVMQGGVTFIMPEIPEHFVEADSDSDASSSCPTIIEYLED